MAGVSVVRMGPNFVFHLTAFKHKGFSKYVA